MFDEAEATVVWALISGKPEGCATLRTDRVYGHDAWTGANAARCLVGTRLCDGNHTLMILSPVDLAGTYTVYVWTERHTRVTQVDKKADGLSPEVLAQISREILGAV